MLLPVISFAAAVGSPQQAENEARVTIRIERPAVATRKAWEKLPKSQRREVERRDERGRLTLLRLIEHQ